MGCKPMPRRDRPSRPRLFAGDGPSALEAPGGGIYFKTWDIEGSLTRRGSTPSGLGGTTIGEVGPDRPGPRVYSPDQRVGTSLRCDAWMAMRSGGATPPRCRAPKAR